MKKTITILMLIVSTLAFSQGKVTLDIYADAKLLLIGDDKGNDPGTIDVLIRSQWQGNQGKIGYTFVFPQFEYANLEGGEYYRWSAGVGYAFTTIIKKIEFSPQVNFGAIQRAGATSMSWDFGGSIQYLISKKLKLSILGSYTQRNDIAYLYNITNVWRFNGYIGFNYSIN